LSATVPNSPARPWRISQVNRFAVLIDGAALFGAVREAAIKAPDQLEELARRLRVESRRGLVENGDFDLAHENLGDAEALAHAARVDADRPVGRVRQMNPLQRVADAFLDLIVQQSAQARGEAQIAAPGSYGRRSRQCQAGSRPGA
jgi:hypothetical protein